MLPLSAELELRRICEKNSSLVASVKEYNVHVKSLEKNVGEEKLNGTALLIELKWSKQEVERRDCENKLL